MTTKQFTMNEEKYIECLEKIICRDYFPDLQKLRLKMEWENAVANNDLPKMREIQQLVLQNKKRKSEDGTTNITVEPQTPNFDVTPLPLKKQKTEHTTTSTAASADALTTPSAASAGAGGSGTHGSVASSTAVAAGGDESYNIDNARLDAFLMQHTSEDNVSFSTLMKSASEKRKKQLWWMNEKTEQQKLIESSSLRPGAGAPLSWPSSYDPKTQLLTYPDMLPDRSLSSTSPAGGLKPVGTREIDASSTRFEEPLLMPERATNSINAQNNNGINGNNNSKKEEEKTFQMLTSHNFTLGARRRAEANKKVNLDDLIEPLPSEPSSSSFQVNGYGFVADPSSTPTKHDPIITWGEIEGTPLLLHTPVVSTATGGVVREEQEWSGFKVPQTPKRDQIGLDLVDKVKAKQRQRTLSSPQLGGMVSGPTTPRSSHSAGGFSSSTSTSSTSTSLLSPLRSEAGQRLAEKLTKRTQKGLDLQLRASYNSPRLFRSATASTPSSTPSSSSILGGPRTPGGTPNKTHATTGATATTTATTTATASSSTTATATNTTTIPPTSKTTTLTNTTTGSSASRTLVTTTTATPLLSKDNNTQQKSKTTSLTDNLLNL